MDSPIQRPRDVPWSYAKTAIGIPGRGGVEDGSRGGAPVWVMKKAWMPVADDQQTEGADPDGMAIFGRYPRGWLSHVVRVQLLGDVHRHEILHVCSGALGTLESWTVDVREAARPRVVADGIALPFRSDRFKAVMLDPPYSEEYARNLYGTENPKPSALLREAARVLVPGGRVGILHVALPMIPPACRLVDVWPISTGLGFRVKAFTVFEKNGDVRQGSLV